MDTNYYITLNTNSIKSVPLRKFLFDKNSKIENIHQKIKNVMLENCTEEEKINLLTKPLHLSINNIQISEHSPKKEEHILKAFRKTTEHPKNNQISILAEHDPEDFYSHYHVLQFRTPTSKHVDLFNKWISEHRQNGQFADLWQPPQIGNFAMVQVRKNVLPLDSGLEVVHHPMDLKKAVQRTKAAASENNRFHSRFHQYDEILNFYSRVERDINRIEGMHCEKRTFGKTTSGEEMIALKIWRDSEIVQNRPKFLMLGGMHSREWVGISTNLMLVAKCLDLEDQKFQRILEKSELHLIPVINVDGYKVSWTDGNRLWRKNIKGVDINRNFPKHENLEDEKNENAEDFGGFKPESEIETRALESYINTNGKFTGCIDWHCFSRKFCFPYAYTRKKPKNYDLLMECAKETVKAITSVNGTKYEFGQIAENIYPCNGTLLDYLFENDRCSFPFVNELDGRSSWISPSEGFLTKPEQIEPIGNESISGFKAFAEFLIANNPRNAHSKLLKQPMSNFTSQRLVPHVAEKTMSYHPIGISNRGNTCYANSVLQCLGVNKVLIKNLLHPRNSGNDEFVKALSNVLRIFWQQITLENIALSKMSLDTMLSKLFEESKLFGKNRLGDASSFALFCADKLMKSPQISPLFDGELLNVIGQNTIRETFFHLVLSNNSPTLMDAVTQFFSAEKLQDGNIKKAYIKSFPRILMVTLKLDPSANAIKMSIPTEISLNSFGLLHDDTGNYELNGVVNFSGDSRNSGHYTATVRDHAGNWYHANDRTVLHNKELRGETEIVTNSAHMLFFTQKTPMKALFY